MFRGDYMDHFGPEKEEGLKYDNEKPRWDILPYDAVNEIVKVMTYGAKKYAPHNWKKVSPARFEAAMMRHFEAYKRGEVYDDESGLMHLSHMACNALFLVYLELHKCGSKITA
jgi:hypothetical protein